MNNNFDELGFDAKKPEKSEKFVYKSGNAIKKSKWTVVVKISAWIFSVSLFLFMTALATMIDEAIFTLILIMGSFGMSLFVLSLCYLGCARAEQVRRCADNSENLNEVLASYGDLLRELKENSTQARQTDFNLPVSGNNDSQRDILHTDEQSAEKQKYITF